MGFFSKWNKQPGSNKERQPGQGKNKTAARPAKPGADPLELAVDSLMAGLPGCERRKDGVYLPAQRLLVRPGISDAHGGFASLVFWVEHPSFEEPFFDMSAGVGKDTAEAVRQSVLGFLCSAFCGVRHCVRQEYAHSLETAFAGRPKRWRVSESCIASIGKDPHTPEGGYWGYIAEKLPHHLGNKGHYWVKVYTSRLRDGSVTCECRVNNQISEELTEAVAGVAKRWDSDAAILSDKQFFFLTQEEGTREPYPFTREQVGEFTARAVRLMADCDTEEKYQRLQEDLTAITGDAGLAAELYSFLPELCAENAFPQISYHESFLISQTGKSNQEVWKDQFMSYRWIQERALDGFSRGEFSRGDYQKLIGMSAIYSVIEQAAKGQKSLDGLRLTSLIISLPDDYRLR